ncbi:MAG: phosphocholine cytidylyltransferase family protein [Polyangiaceae bacterium]
MKAIIIGAGRGSRLGNRTDEVPKALVEVVGKPMLDHILVALREAGFENRDIVFVCGYKEEVVRARYPELTFVRNADWEHNNILASLLCAREHLAEGFVSTYADIVYEPGIVSRLCRAPEDIVLGVDTAWRRRYAGRTQHPESDAEKVRLDGRRVSSISRHVNSDLADGEFIGVMKLSPSGAAQLVQAFDEAKQRHAGQLFREGRSFERAYLIDLLALMQESGVPLHREVTMGGYMEIDTQQDLEYSERWWRTWTESKATH